MTDIPAFPRQHAVADANDPAFKLGCEGMSLRDYFAAKVMQATVSKVPLCSVGSSFHGARRIDDDEFARIDRSIATAAYQLADAMVAERAASAAAPQGRR